MPLIFDVFLFLLGKKFNFYVYLAKNSIVKGCTKIKLNSFTTSQLLISGLKHHSISKYR